MAELPKSGQLERTVLETGEPVRNYGQGVGDAAGKMMVYVFLLLLAMYRVEASGYKGIIKS